MNSKLASNHCTGCSKFFSQSEFLNPSLRKFMLKIFLITVPHPSDSRTGQIWTWAVALTRTLPEWGPAHAQRRVVRLRVQRLPRETFLAYDFPEV